MRTLGNGIPRDSIAPDRKLPALAVAAHSEEMALRLRPLCHAQGALQVTLLKHVEGKRAVLLYRFADGTQLVGKMYRKDRAQQHARVLEAVHQALQGSTRTPRPLACMDDIGLLVQEFLSGEPAPHWAEMVDRPEVLDRMAQALAELHAVRLRVGSPATLADHVRRTCHPGLQTLRLELPHLGSLLRGVEDAMYRREDSTPQRLVPCHGDFGPGQMLLAPEQVSLLDLDGLAHSDAALDVGNFLVGLRVHAGLDARALTRHFLQAYLRAADLRELPGLPHWEAFAYLRRAMILRRKRPVGWEEQVLHLAERAHQGLHAA